MKQKILITSGNLERGRVSPCCMESMKHDYDQRDGDWWTCTKCNNTCDKKAHLFIIDTYTPLS
jgi:hypothetical protein